VLLQRYAIARVGNVDYNNTRYVPRGWKDGATVPDLTWGTGTVTDAGPYVGYDLFYAPNGGSVRADDTADWLTVTLWRPSRIVLIWRNGASPPSCFAGWPQGADVVVSGDRYHTWTQDVGAGDTVLCGPAAGLGGVHDTYWLLFAETGGRPSADPMPGVAPNKPCPSGYFGGGWHPQIDPTTWCYAGHEHGEDPTFCDPTFDPRYGVAAAAMGMTEGEAGFKTFAFTSGGRCWVITLHQGTSGAARLCTRHHTIGVAIWERGTKQVDITFMGDFGIAVNNNNHSAVIVPASGACQDLSGHGGKRQISVLDDGAIGYEPWSHGGGGDALNLVGSFVVNTLDVATACDHADPCTLVATGDSGTKRFFQGSDFGFAANHPSGTFCTDSTATHVIDCGTAGTIRQYMAAGYAATVGINKVLDFDGWGQPGTPAESDLDFPYWHPTERENSITGAN
jgi:hypothetical protein